MQLLKRLSKVGFNTGKYVGNMSLLKSGAVEGAPAARKGLLSMNWMERGDDVLKRDLAGKVMRVREAPTDVVNALKKTIPADEARWRANTGQELPVSENTLKDLLSQMSVEFEPLDSGPGSTEARVRLFERMMGRKATKVPNTENLFRLLSVLGAAGVGAGALRGSEEDV